MLHSVGINESHLDDANDTLIELPLRRYLRRALARDLGLPEGHVAVTATLAALAHVSLDRDALAVESDPALLETVPDHIEDVSLETWCCVFANAFNSAARAS